MLEQMIEQSSGDLEATEQKVAELQPQEGVLKELNLAIVRKGNSCFVVEGVLEEL